MKVLCIYTNKFPYTDVEPYLETEVLNYKGFDKVYVFSLIVKKTEETIKRSMPDNIEVFPIRINKIGYIFGAIKALFDREFHIEIKRIQKKQGISIDRILALLLFISRAHVDSKKISRLIKDRIQDCDTVFYTYRFEYQPYTAILVKKRLNLNNIPIISRAHGYDLYENRAKGNYLPLREELLKNLEWIFPCSKAGELYLKDNYPIWKDKVSTRYLGSSDYGIEDYSNLGNGFRIVSCSNIVSIKRIDRIIDVLSQLHTTNIEWVHIGAGKDEESIRKRALDKLDQRIKTVFMGSMSNTEVMSYYKQNKIDLFINLSDSEGLPVSIMEAFSFGIPCVATNVGGTSEIVETGVNGYLVELQDNDASIAQTIDMILNMRPDEYMKLRSGARDTWEAKFNANKNYKEFNDELLKICDSNIHN